VLDGPFIETKEWVAASAPVLGRAGLALSRAGRFASVNGLRMYYEAHGSGRPLVLLHGALSTIDGSFGGVLAGLASGRRVIAVEQQSHGRTSDIDRPLSYAQMADDTAELLRQLDIRQADVFGYSMGAVSALELTLRHPGLVRKLALASGSYRLDGYVPELARFMRNLDPTDGSAPPIAHPLGPDRMGNLRRELSRVAPMPRRWRSALARIKEAFASQAGVDEEGVRAIRAHTFVIGGDRDIVYPQHLHELARCIPHARLSVLPETGHVDVVARSSELVAAFLDEPLPR
jgi:pimeloyl-ACP methyl ester carboxylesterase